MIERHREPRRLIAVDFSIRDSVLLIARLMIHHAVLWPRSIHRSAKQARISKFHPRSALRPGSPRERDGRNVYFRFLLCLCLFIENEIKQSRKFIFVGSFDIYDDAVINFVIN